MTEVKKMYVSSISQGAISPKRQIPAGTPFPKDALILKTFEAFVKKGYITEVVADAPITVIKPSPLEVIGLPAKTPSAAITPLKGLVSEGVQDEGVQDKIVSERDAVIAELTMMQVKFNQSAKTKTLKKRLAKAKATAITPPAMTPLDVLKTVSIEPASVWNYDSQELEKRPLEQLLAMYKERCTEFDKEKEVFTDKDLLILKMTSEASK